MGKSSPPSPPNPQATAQAQTASNVNTAAAQAALNDINQFTPFGSTTYAQTGTYTTPSGEVVPTYTQNSTLSPLAQSILTGTEGMALNALPQEQNLRNNAYNAANTSINFNTPFTALLQQAPQDLRAFTAQGPQAINDKVAQALYGEESGFLNPQWQLQQQQLQDQLSRQGIMPGSDAYDNAMTQLANSRTQAYQSAQDAAITAGVQAGGQLWNEALAGNEQLFNENLAGQQQAVTQQEMAQQAPMMLAQEFMGMTPNIPQQPFTMPSQVNVAPTDVIGAQGLSTQAQQAQYQAQLAQQNATFGGLASLGSAGLLALALS